MKQTKKTTRCTQSEKTKQAMKEFETILHEELCLAFKDSYIVSPNLLVPNENRQKYRYLTDSTQFPLEGAIVSSIKLGQGIPTIRVKQDLELAYDGGLAGDSYYYITIEVSLYTLQIYKRVVVVYTTNDQQAATCFETFCQQKGVKYVKLDKPSKDKKKTIQQWIGAMDAMDRLYRTSHTK